MKTLRIKSSLSELERMRDFLKSCCRKIKISDKDYFKIELALLEVCVNIIRYAYPQSNGEIMIRAWQDKDRIYLEIRDQGVPFDPRELKPPDIDDLIKNQRKGGLGVFLSRTLMDGFDYKRENNQNVLTIYKNLKGAEASL
ncbi:MAG: ATP-binding protein [Candidatus Aminicenantes bacterium]|nr:ATP-binding protein [Candidatus Aminicenantes bacterium]MDH5466852.1 ATP-binding protein [Candidatus Aminicenantes bacterium]MDH5705695.1 ATP-binding protein [Candidatus Aminicenantes bacterium]